MMEVQTSQKLSKLRCDNGGEYTDNQLKQWFRNKGIQMDITVPHSPQLNGKAERLNRTIIEKARSLIFDSGMSKDFWGEAARFAAFLLNRSPTEATVKTPIEMLTNDKPDLSRLQIFGSISHAKVLSYVKKLDERSKKYILVGYAQNGYRLWDENQRRIIIRRDVIFEAPKLQHEENLKLKEKNEPVIYLDTEVDIKQEEIIEEQEDATVDVQNRENIDNLETTRTRSGREIKVPKRFEDYVLMTYEEALNSPDNKDWEKAINEEKE